MILNDWQIKRFCEETNLITPFFDTQQRGEQKNKISYGLSSFGYDCRLAPDHLQLFRKNIPNREDVLEEIDPKNFKQELIGPQIRYDDLRGECSYFVQ